ncbi:hypothetical protein LFYK43_00320 [Ligilactobacillus salitolerans]|uniref:Uncharacterized protein n=1 Tax=Ligilactobacillus salitolerans TaxID=1808352 RepID=A0A401IPZ1_9LACO|nr:hypothetical protein [Ligilactobacillus salitolerans]GBG93573.1 hypothetical protein LFYK43_00320 [Ligilactobacillus salitolerans]
MLVVSLSLHYGSRYEKKYTRKKSGASQPETRTARGEIYAVTPKVAKAIEKKEGTFGICAIFRGMYVTDIHLYIRKNYRFCFFILHFFKIIFRGLKRLPQKQKKTYPG